MFAHPRCLLPMAVGAAAVWMPAATRVFAFDDKDFCIAAQQLALAANNDVGLWIDRTTRNGGMTVACDARRIEFKRFSYAPSSSMTESWKELKSAEWNATHCNNPIWSEAIRGGWQIALTVTTADGSSASISAQCQVKK